MFMSTILVLAYKNVLLSKLITSTFEEPIDSVDDMLEQKGGIYTQGCTKRLLPGCMDMR